MTNPRLEELRAKFQENPRRYFAPYANELRKAGDPAQAIAVCRTHLAGQPGHVSGHIVLGQALYEAGETGEARDTFTAALELDPENLIALRSLGEIAQINGEFDSARQWYQRLLDADPRNNEVAQLLRDIPTAPVVKPIEMASAAAEPADEPTPFTIREEIAAAEAPAEPVPAAPSFHTSFTGPGRAYKTAEDLREEAEALAKKEAETKEDTGTADESEDAFVDLQPTAHDQADSAPVARSQWEPPVESESGMVELTEETSDEPAVAESPSSAPDETFDLVVSDYASESKYEREEGEAPPTAFDSEGEVVPEQLVSEVGFESQATESYPAPAEPVEASLEIEDFAGDALNPESSAYAAADEAEESPRAMFAERGFDSAAEEDAGWMTTPSAALSDLEAAPEDWFDVQKQEAETSAEASGDDARRAEADIESPTPEASADQTTDSWFDEVPGATSIEATEVASDELWLPPVLPPFTSPDATAQPDDESSPQPAEEPAWSASLDEELLVGAPSDSLESSHSSEAQAPASAELDEPEESAWAAVQHEEQSETAPDEFEQAVAAETSMDVHAESTGLEVEATSGDVSEEFAGSAEASNQTGWSSSESIAEAEAQTFEEHDSVEVPPVFAAASSSPEMSPPAGDAIGHTPEDAIPAPTPAPFITETLAELYLQQGFRDEALSIYRQLLDRSPDDESLKSRISSIEERATSAPAPVNAEIRAASQSVRTFFSRLAKRPAVSMQASTSPSAIGQQEPEVPFSVAASALANLFSASKTQQSDEGAAATLAGAFNDPAGRPSRAAERELSLDHLFRDVPPGGTAAGGVTLDEFYSNPGAATGSSTEPGSESGPEDPGGTDIRQFTAWLEGLRKK
jgi:tetratricopeptide (TPR) repeat protein